MHNRKKAKSTETWEWIYGSITRAGNNAYIIEDAKIVNKKPVITSATQVNDLTVCDFITIVSTDDNMFAELYENDIIQTNISTYNEVGENPEPTNLTGTIIWNNDELQWDVETTTGDIYKLSMIIEVYGIKKIIGNFFDQLNNLVIAKQRK